MNRYLRAFALMSLISWVLNTDSIAQISVSGTIKDLSNEMPIPGVRVDLRTKEGLDPYEPMITYADAKGLYSLKNIPPGEWRIRVIYGNADVLERVIMTPVISSGEGSIEFNFKINQEVEDFDEQVRSVRMRYLGEDVLASHITVTGSVEELGGKHAIASARISFLEKADITDNGTIYKTVAQTKSDSSGTFEIPLLPRGLYLMDVYHPGYESSARAQIRVTRPVELRIEMWEGTKRPDVPGLVFDGKGQEIKNVIRTTRRVYAGTLTGRLIYGKIPARGAKIFLLNGDDRVVPGIETGESDATGVYRIENIDPGIYKVHIEHGDDVYEVDGVTIILGQNELNITR